LHFELYNQSRRNRDCGEQRSSTPEGYRGSKEGKMRKTTLMFVLCFIVLLLQSTTGAMAADVQVVITIIQSTTETMAVDAPVQKCRMIIDPSDKTRDVNWETDCVLVLMSPQTVSMAWGLKPASRCQLTTGTSVVIDKESGKAKYVRFCHFPLVGQPILTGQRYRASPLPSSVDLSSIK